LTSGAFLNLPLAKIDRASGNNPFVELTSFIFSQKKIEKLAASLNQNFYTTLNASDEHGEIIEDKEE